MRLVLPFSFTRLSLPVSLLLLSLVPGSYVLPSSTHAPWKTTHTSTDYTIIWSQMKNCIITQAPLVESLISFQSCIIILAHVLLSGGAFGGSCSFGILRDFVDSFIVPFNGPPRGVLWKLIFFFCSAWRLRKGLFLISLDTQQRYIRIVF